jgi:hypothetical protein
MLVVVDQGMKEEETCTAAAGQLDDYVGPPFFLGSLCILSYDVTSGFFPSSLIPVVPVQFMAQYSTLPGLTPLILIA